MRCHAERLSLSRLSRRMPANPLLLDRTVPEVPEWPQYSISEPANMAFNATFADNTIYTRVEADTWREEGLELWNKYAVELSFNGNWRP